MSKNRPIPLKVSFFDIVSTLSLAVWIDMSMVLSKIIILVYYKVSEPSISVGTYILIVKLCA